MLNTVLKSVEGMKRNVPFSCEKEKRRAAVLYWKMEMRRLKGIAIDTNLKEKRRTKAEIDKIHLQELDEVKQELERAKVQWKDIVERGKEIREQEILDYHYSVVSSEDENQRKMKKKIIAGIKRKLFKTHTFHYISRHVGKGDRDGIKRIHTVDDSNQIIKTYVNRKQIENKISRYNEKHLKKAYESIIYKDKIYKILRNDSIRDKILEGRLRRDECDKE